jgi:hypothetical protein
MPGASGSFGGPDKELTKSVAKTAVRIPPTITINVVDDSNRSSGIPDQKYHMIAAVMRPYIIGFFMIFFPNIENALVEGISN